MKPFEYYTCKVPYPDTASLKKQLAKDIDEAQLSTAERANLILHLNEFVKEKLKPEFDAYNAGQKAIDAEFWADARADLGHTDFLTVRGVGIVEAKAYELGHSSGYSEIYGCLIDVVDFVKRIKNEYKSFKNPNL